VGIGPGQFANYEGQSNVVFGGHGYYQEAHNVYTKVSSECGIPALFFFVAGLVSSYRLLNKTYKEARKRPDCTDIANTAFCIMLGMAGFLTAITFLNLAYYFYMPALGGLAIAVSRAGAEEICRRASGHPPPMWAPLPALNSHSTSRSGL